MEADDEDDEPLELVESEPEAEGDELPAHLVAMGFGDELPEEPADAPPTTRKGLREHAQHEVPEGHLEFLKRTLSYALAGWVPLFYLPFVALMLAFRGVPGFQEDYAWPGQAVATAALSFCLYERTASSRVEAQNWDPMELGSVLWKSLLFYAPFLVGVGTAQDWQAYAVIPLVLVLPVILGAMSCNDPTELLPQNLIKAAWNTPHYLRCCLATSAGLGAGLWAVWWTSGNPLARGCAAVLAFSFAGAAVGGARRDAEVG